MDSSKKENKGLVIGASLALVVLIAVIGATIGLTVFNETQKSKNGGDNQNTTQNIDVDNIDDSEFSKSTHTVEEVADKISPSVVSIISTGSSNAGGRYNFSTLTQNAGTGFIVSKDGYIATNKHVVSGHSSISIITHDGEVYEGVKVVATDPLNDLAFLKIEGVDNLIPAELGDSKTLKVGQEVIAIGNALGQYQNTVTSGIISGLNREIQAEGSNGEVESLSGLLQTDAAINSGNSGGPLVNSRGQVIGINTAKSEEGAGIGFAIPISAIKGVLKSLIAGNGGERAVLGISYVAITPDFAKSENLSTKQGAYITEDGIIKNGPADKAGLKAGDIITQVNGAKVGEAGSILALVSEYSVGDTISITIVSNGDTRNIDITLEAYKE